MTKTKLTRTEIEPLVRQAFGGGTTTRDMSELTGGMFNAAYRLRLSDGRETILKVSPPADARILTYETDIMRTEVEALRLVYGLDGVPVPEVYHYDPSRSLIGSEFFFMEFVPGTPYNELKSLASDAERAEIEREIGRINRRINAVTGSGFGLPGRGKPGADSSWSSVFVQLMDDLLEDGQRLGVVLPMAYAEAEQAAAQLQPALEAVNQPQLVHWDLWEGNVMIREGRIVSILDWERALWGDPLMEYFFRRFVDNRQFLEGYGSHAEDTGSAARKALYDLYLGLIMVIECRSREYTDAGHITWVQSNLAAGWEHLRTILHS